MKHLLIILFICGNLCLPIAAQQTSLNVTGGSRQSGKIGRTMAHIWANPAPPNTVFDRWTGDTALVQDIFAAQTRVNPLKKNINLTATYKSAPAWTPIQETINGTSVLYHIPANHIGIIFRFHGATGNAQFVLNRPEDRIFANDAVAAGYGIIALNSVDRLNGRWSLAAPPNNPDVVNVQTVITNFRNRGLIRQDEAIFAHGTSFGGTFSSLVSYFLNFKGAAIYISFGVNQVMTQTTVPTIFCPASNDDNPNVGQTGNQTAFNQFLNLQSRNIKTSFNNLLQSPVYPERFWRIPGLTQADSQAIYNALKTNGFLDNRDYLIERPSTSNWQAVIPAQYSQYINGIDSQLDICFADHHFYSDYNSRVLRFFAEIP